MVVSVALLISTAYCSPLSGVTRSIVNLSPSAFFGSMLMADEVQPLLGGHRADHVRTGGAGRDAARQAVAQLERALQETVAHTGALRLVAELLEGVGESRRAAWFFGSANTSLFKISVA